MKGMLKLYCRLLPRVALEAPEPRLSPNPPKPKPEEPPPNRPSKMLEKPPPNKSSKPENALGSKPAPPIPSTPA